MSDIDPKRPIREAAITRGRICAKTGREQLQQILNDSIGHKAPMGAAERRIETPHQKTALNGSFHLRRALE